MVSVNKHFLPDETINTKQLSDLFESLGPGSVELHQQALDLFLENTPLLMEKIEQQIEHFTADALMMSLHAMKGNCELYGATWLANLCKELEHELRNQKEVDLTARIRTIAKEFSAVHSYPASISPMREYLKKDGHGQSDPISGAKTVAIPK